MSCDSVAEVGHDMLGEPHKPTSHDMLHAAHAC